MCFDTKDVALIDAYDPSALDEAADALDRDGLVVLPTDTVYGIAARLDRPKALERLFVAKRRAKDLPVAVLAGTLEEARSIGIFDEHALVLAKSLWPGALTLVVPRADGFEASLGADSTTVGIRIPNHPVALQLIVRSGPLAASSANLSGEETPATVAAIADSFRDSVSVYLDAGPSSDLLPSTVVSVRDGAVEILRQGALPESEINATWNPEGR